MELEEWHSRIRGQLSVFHAFTTLFSRARWQMDFKITAASKDTCLWIELRGNLHSTTAIELQRTTDNLGEEQWLVLDVSELAYMDSAGLGTLLALHKACHGQGKALILLAIPPLMKKFLSTTGLLGVFHQAESESDVQRVIELVEKSADKSL